MAGKWVAAYPDGLEDDHAIPDRGFRRHASPASILILGALMLAALLGVFAGRPAEPVAVHAPEAVLKVSMPKAMRNGVFFETLIEVTARQPIAKPEIAVSPGLWRDLTINTMIPAATEERMEKGMFRFAYDALQPGDRLVVKIDGQVNPSLFAGTGGDIALFDGEREIARMPLEIRVLP